jgi:hypothetical protein
VIAKYLSGIILNRCLHNVSSSCQKISELLVFIMGLVCSVCMLIGSFMAVFFKTICQLIIRTWFYKSVNQGNSMMLPDIPILAGIGLANLCDIVQNNYHGCPLSSYVR